MIFCQQLSGTICDDSLVREIARMDLGLISFSAAGKGFTNQGMQYLTMSEYWNEDSCVSKTALEGVFFPLK